MPTADDKIFFVTFGIGASFASKRLLTYISIAEAVQHRKENREWMDGLTPPL